MPLVNNNDTIVKQSYMQIINTFLLRVSELNANGKIFDFIILYLDQTNGHMESS